MKREANEINNYIDREDIKKLQLNEDVASSERLTS